MLEVYFPLSGRIGRWRFFLYSCLLFLSGPLLFLLATLLAQNAPDPRAVANICVVGIVAFWMWAGLALVVKRLHNIDKPGWHYLWMFLLPGLLGGGLSVGFTTGHDGRWAIGFHVAVGTVPLIAMLYLIFARGSEGPNTFGYPP
jgi:uncharacterized membrane protein YhaH (DUF805 family)